MSIGPWSQETCLADPLPVRFFAERALHARTPIFGPPAFLKQGTGRYWRASE